MADISGQGWLTVSGPDRLDFVHRLSTNDLNSLRPGQGLPTVLTNAQGRVIAALTAYAAEDELYLRTAPGQAAAVARYLNSMIFFNDRVTVADLSADVAQFALLGPAAADMLSRLEEGAAVLPSEPYSWRKSVIAGHTVALQRGGPLALPDWTLVAARAAAETVWATLTRAAPALDEAASEVLRVERGLAAWGHELSNQVTPLESGMSAAISYSKGCYTGQEVIARQTHYDKVTRRLVGLLLPDECGAGQEAGAGQDSGETGGTGLRVPAGLVGAPVKAGGGRPGFVGSAVYSPALRRCVALAVVQRDAAEAGKTVTIMYGAQEITATVCALPFDGGK